MKHNHITSSLTKSDDTLFINVLQFHYQQAVHNDHGQTHTSMKYNYIIQRRHKRKSIQILILLLALQLIL